MTSRPAPAARLHVQEHLPPDLVAQQHRGVGHRQRGDAVDRFDHVPLAHVHARPGERGERIGVVRVGAVDVGDAIPSGGFVSHQLGPQRGGLDLLPPLAQVAAVDEDVERGQLAHHLAEEVRQLGAVRDPGDERSVLLQHRGPVHAVHVAVVEVVALEPPRLDEHLMPLLARIDGELPRGEIDLLLREIGLLARRGVEHRDVVALADHHLLAVARELELLDVGDEASWASAPCS